MSRPDAMKQLAPAAKAVPRLRHLEGEVVRRWPRFMRSSYLSLAAISVATCSACSDPASGTTPASPNPAIPPLAMPACPASEQPQQPLGAGVMCGEGESTDRYAKAQVTRDGRNYSFMANGWGPKFESHSVSWKGTSFAVESLVGFPGDNWEPASYPAMFCGQYSSERSMSCGLPAAIGELSTLRTGWSWAANGNTSDYNVAYDIWLGDASGAFTGYFMVWLRDPPGQQPAGRPTSHSGISVANVDGLWDIWEGEVNRAPIINYVREEGQDSPRIEFDVLDFFRDAQTRGLQLPGERVLSVAIGFEVWEGPITNLQSLDFYVDPKKTTP